MKKIHPATPVTIYDEARILSRVQQGDEEAFGQLLQRHAGNLYAQALAYTKSSEVAQDIVQDVFLKIWARRSGLAGISSFEDYLFVMARNRIISVMRKKLMLPLGDGMQDLIPDDGPSAEQRLSLKQAEDILENGIALMPPQRQQVFRMSRKEGLSYAEIGERLGISTSTVKGHIIQALSFLRDHLREQGALPAGLILLLHFSHHC
jgi:RNA polymerase sigma-70 factor (ECF subfamily)